jgi:hypothetical protein
VVKLNFFGAITGSVTFEFGGCYESTPNSYDTRIKRCRHEWRLNGEVHRSECCATFRSRARTSAHTEALYGATGVASFYLHFIKWHLNCSRASVMRLYTETQININRSVSVLSEECFVLALPQGAAGRQSAKYILRVS